MRCRVIQHGHNYGGYWVGEWGRSKEDPGMCGPWINLNFVSYLYVNNKHLVTVFVSWSFLCLIVLSSSQKKVCSQIHFTPLIVNKINTNPNTVYFLLFLLIAVMVVCVLWDCVANACKHVCTCIHDKTARTVQTVLQTSLFCTLIFQLFEGAWMDLSWSSRSSVLVFILVSSVVAQHAVSNSAPLSLWVLVSTWIWLPSTSFSLAIPQLPISSHCTVWSCLNGSTISRSIAGVGVWKWCFVFGPGFKI